MGGLIWIGQMICRASIALVVFAVAGRCHATAATNAFAVAVGADVRAAGDNVFHYSPAGGYAVDVTVSAPNRNAKSSPQQMTNNVVAQAWKALSTSKWMRHDYGVDNVYLRLQNGCSNSVWRVEFARRNYDGFGGGVCVYIDAASLKVLGLHGTK